MASRPNDPTKRQNPRPPGSSNYTQDVVVLNDFSGVTFEQRTRTNKTTGVATARYSLSIEAEPILHNLDGVMLGRGPAEAIRDLLVKQAKAIGEFATPATQAFREKMRDALAGKIAPKGSVRRRGVVVATRSLADLARERYTGGRTGTKEPMAGGTDRIGVDSGRLSEGFYVMQNPVEGSFTVNVPENRFDPKTWGGTMASLQEWVKRWVSLMPALANPRSILESDEFVRAVGQSKPVQVLANGSMQIWKAYAGAARSVLGQARRFL